MLIPTYFLATNLRLFCCKCMTGNLGSLLGFIKRFECEVHIARLYFRPGVDAIQTFFLDWYLANFVDIQQHSGFAPILPYTICLRIFWLNAFQLNFFALQMMSKEKQRSDAVRSEPIFVDGNGRKFWRSSCCSSDVDILLQGFFFFFFFPFSFSNFVRPIL